MKLLFSICIKIVFKISLFSQTPTGGFAQLYFKIYLSKTVCTVLCYLNQVLKNIGKYIIPLNQEIMTKPQQNILQQFHVHIFIWYTGSIFSLSVVLNDFIFMHTLLNSFHLWYQRDIHLNSYYTCSSLLNNCIEIITSALYYAIQFQTFITTTDSHIIHILGLQ